ncbi:PAP2 superfamily-domain-containing protein [Phaeosphaeriaceae sp. PMI808]|nr:PAP2 superfamily-domain-containing protein [Phaeosphaeriaceae sp. PMI808]
MNTGIQDDASVSAPTPPTPASPLHSKEPRLDAGNKHHDHYSRRLPKWRNALRNRLLPIVRWETPWLALMQDKLRSPALDSYFAYTANLGTHTFFMVFLPIQFWCGYTSIGRATVFMLAAGVYLTGALKDLLCLPRPLSPPLKRISMSGSAALEYGFPSSHSANAVSVTFYAVYTIRQSPEAYHPYVYIGMQAFFYFYAISIIFGRLYCGMHGFLDIGVGSIMGALITAFYLVNVDWLDSWIFSGTYTDILIATVFVLILIRINPEPADDCPCFDDSVSFLGVVVGINIGAWHYAQTGYAIDYPIPSTAPFDLEKIGLVKATLRVLLGVVVIFLWRAAAKPALLKVLPPFFRLLEHARLNLPRAFFLEASKYTSIPTLRDDDNLIPSASELPHKLMNLAHPRKRSVSVGPQSAADAYETLAYRSRRRRESVSSRDGGMPEDGSWSPSPRLQSKPQTPALEKAEPQLLVPPPGDEKNASGEAIQFSMTLSDEENDSEKREIFMMLTKPRVRYDVEVVTKLIVYSGIAWVAVEGNPLLFELVGLGMP